MGNKKNPLPATVRTVLDLAQYADILGVTPSSLISEDGELMLPGGPQPAA